MCKTCCVKKIIILITMEIEVFDACQVDVQLKKEIFGYTYWIMDVCSSSICGLYLFYQLTVICVKLQTICCLRQIRSL
jgi:hypothetical protein